jgi:hypothetical protein
LDGFGNCSEFLGWNFCGDFGINLFDENRGNLLANMTKRTKGSKTWITFKKVTQSSNSIKKVHQEKGVREFFGDEHEIT